MTGKTALPHSSSDRPVYTHKLVLYSTSSNNAANVAGVLSDGMTGHFAAVLLLLVGAAEAIKFLVEPSFEYYGGRGQCIKMRIPGNSLVTGFFKIAPQPDVKSNVVVL